MLSAVVALTPTVLSTPAHADPAATVPDPGATTVALSELGSDDGFALYGLRGSQTVSIPVPPGMTPTTLTAHVQLPAGVRGGTIAVTQDERTLSDTSIPTGFQAPLSISLTGAAVVGNAITVSLRSFLDPRDGYCLFDPSLPLRLSAMTVSFSGSPAPPRTVAEFLPPMLRQLVLAVPPAPTRAEADAAVRMASAVVARYGKQHPRIELATISHDQPAPATPFERRVIIQEAGAGAVWLQPGATPPTLQISGPAEQLANQSRLLSSDMAKLAMASRALAGPLHQVPQLAADTTTLRALGQPDVTAVALNPQVSIAIDQTRLGRPSHAIRVHLIGSHTPLPAGLGSDLVASVNGETVDRWTGDPSGVIDRWITVPDRALMRFINVVVALNISGNTGRCGEFQPLRLIVDGDSVLTSSPAHPPIPTGFQSLPQALMPHVVIGLDEHSLADTARAVAIMVALQRLSALPIDTTVQALPDAIASSESAVLIAADGWHDARIALPVNTVDGAIEVTSLSGQKQSVTLNPDVRYGSLQIAMSGKRTVLVATSTGAPQQLDTLLDWVSADTKRWAGLSGAAILAPQGQDPVVIAAAPPDPPPPSTSHLWLTCIAIAALGAAVAVAGYLALVRRRRRAGTAPTG